MASLVPLAAVGPLVWSNRHGLLYQMACGHREISADFGIRVIATRARSPIWGLRINRSTHMRGREGHRFAGSIDQTTDVFIDDAKR